MFGEHVQFRVVLCVPFPFTVVSFIIAFLCILHDITIFCVPAIDLLVFLHPESTIQWNSAGKTYGRTRGQGPTPAASTESLNHSDTLPRSLQRTRKVSDQPPTPDRTRRSSKLVTPPKSPAKTKTPSTLKSPGSLSNNLSAAPSNRETTNKGNLRQLIFYIVKDAPQGFSSYV